MCVCVCVCVCVCKDVRLGIHGVDSIQLGFACLLNCFSRDLPLHECPGCTSKHILNWDGFREGVGLCRQSLNTSDIRKRSDVASVSVHWDVQTKNGFTFSTKT